GDLSETVALMWPKGSLQAHSAPLPPRRGGEGSGVGGGAVISETTSCADVPPTPDPSPPRAKRVEGGDGSTGHHNPPPTLTEVVTTLRMLGKTELPGQLSRWLDELDVPGRWALLKLVVGAMRIGISARLAKT